ncbi:hypothetical protein HK100_005749, partial [Physocladia obscura]
MIQQQNQIKVKSCHITPIDVDTSFIDGAAINDAVDAFFVTARFSDESVVGETLKFTVMKKFSEAFEFKPHNFVVVDIYDTTTFTEDTEMAAAAEKSRYKIFGTPADKFIPFQIDGKVVLDLGFKTKRSSTEDLYAPPPRPAGDSASISEVIKEIYLSEQRFFEDLRRAKILHDSFLKRAKEAATTAKKKFCMDVYHVQKCFPVFDEYIAISVKFLKGFDDYFRFQKNFLEKQFLNISCVARLVIQYIDDLRPLMEKSGKNFGISQSMLEGLIALPEVQSQIEDAISEMGYHLEHKPDPVSLQNLPINRINSLRNGIIGLLSRMCEANPASKAFERAAQNLHKLSRSIEISMDEADAQELMIKLGNAVNESKLASSQKKYLFDYHVEPSCLNGWNDIVNCGLETRIMLLSDMVVVLVKFPKAKKE